MPQSKAQQPKRNSIDRMNAWKRKELPPFAEQLTTVVVQQFGEYYYVNDVATWLETNAATASAWLWGKQIPDSDHCRILAAKTEKLLGFPLGAGFDFWMALAGRLTLSELREEASRNRNVWKDGEYIHKALQLTTDFDWRNDTTSQWKSDAEEEIEGWLVARMTALDFRRVAYRVARWVDAWHKDRKSRFVPLSPQRFDRLSA